MRRPLLVSFALVWAVLLMVRWHVAMQPRPVVASEVGVSYLGMLARVALYPPHWLWPGQSQRLLDMVLTGIPSTTPEGLAQQALIAGAEGHSARARQLWSQVEGTGWPAELARYYREGQLPKELPPPGFFRDQFELDAGRLPRAEMEVRAQQVAGVVSTVALLAALSFSASLLALLSLPWWAARWPGEFPDPAPPLEGALRAFLSWQLLGWLVIPTLVQGLPDPWRLFIAQIVLYALGLALLRPLLRPRLRVTWQLVALGVTGYWLCLPAALLAGWLTKLLGFTPQSVNPALKLVLESQGWQVVAMGLLVAVVGPCFEELLFRGVLYRSFRQRLGLRGAILASAVLFAVVHADPAMVLPLLSLGVIFAWLTERSGSLVPSMLAHSFWNGATFLLLTLSRGG